MNQLPGTRLQTVAPTPEAALSTLVENRRITTYDDFALSFFETHVRAEQVPLTFPHFVLTAMLRGRKVMHLPGAAPFEYLPGEAVLLPAHRPMYIDFPDARPGNPTQCLALEISAEKVTGLLQRLNEHTPRLDSMAGAASWTFDPADCHVPNSPALAASLDRLLTATREEGPSQGFLADLAVSEIVVRLLQTQARRILLAPTPAAVAETGNRLRLVVEYVRANLHRDLPTDELARLACLSRAQFFRAFRRELGLSPVEFILQERIGQACRLLRAGNRYLADVAYQCGFSSPSYFTRVFKATMGHAPGQWLRSLQAA
jgi:AraC-like DNA-binding protein